MPAFARGISLRIGLPAVVLALTGAALLLLPASAAPAAVPGERTPLSTPWSLVAVNQGGPVEEVFDGIHTDAVFGWDAAAAAYETWQRALPDGLNTLREIRDGQAVWVKTSQQDSFRQRPFVGPHAVVLVDGWTLVGWTTRSLPAAAAAEILGAQILITYAGPSQTFQRYAETAPAFLNTLQTVRQGAGLWVFRDAAGAATIPAPPASDAPSPLLAQLAALTVRAEQLRTGYDRSLFRHWVDADGDGCDTRREVLIAEAVTAPTIGAGCALSGGRWRSVYDNATETGSGRGFDVDHLVPLAEAWESGAWAWSRDDRERYANDLGYDHALVAVSARSNRAKGARDPAEWLPPDESAHCWYAAAWITVKVRWDLTVDSAEADTLRSRIAGCDGDPAGPAPADPPAAEPPPESMRCHPAYDPCLPYLSGDALDCGDLTQAQKPVRVRVIGVDPYRLDRDRDGRGCTS